MKLDRLALSIIPSLLALAVGCAEAPGAYDDSEVEPVATEASQLAVVIERAERLLERGDSASEAKALLEQALADPQISLQERSLAVLALSRAQQALGNDEAAIALIERELAAHANDNDWPDRDFRRQLRKLLTGSESAGPDSIGAHGKTPRFARVLSRYFPVADDGRVEIMTQIIGRQRGMSEDIGTFNVVGGIYAELEASCPLCNRQLNISQGTWRGDWTDIPATQSRFDTRMVVFYYDLEDNRIPARYEQYLPMPIATIEEQLGQGKSLVVAKERPGAPPVLLLATPRTAMLEDLERQFSDHDKLPTEPFVADVSLRLRPHEIQGVIRSQWFPHAKGCYEELLKRDPAAGGKLVLDYAIEGKDGSVVDATVETDDRPFEEETFQTCLLDSLTGLRFPAFGSGRTTVRYPVVMTPGDD